MPTSHHRTYQRVLRPILAIATCRFSWSLPAPTIRHFAYLDLHVRMASSSACHSSFCPPQPASLPWGYQRLPFPLVRIDGRHSRLRRSTPASPDWGYQRLLFPLCLRTLTSSIVAIDAFASFLFLPQPAPPNLAFLRPPSSNVPITRRLFLFRCLVCLKVSK